MNERVAAGRLLLGDALPEFGEGTAQAASSSDSDITAIFWPLSHAKCKDDLEISYTVRMKLDTGALRYLTSEDWRVLAAVGHICDHLRGLAY